MAYRAGYHNPAAAAIPGATVSLLGQNGATRSTTSKSDGTFSFEGVAPGSYGLKAELAGFGSPDHSRGPFPGALWLQVRDIAATQAELQARGVPIAREARREPWGLREMHVTDPDGITLIFVEVPGEHPLRRDTRGEGGGTSG